MRTYTVSIGEFHRLVVNPHPYSADPCVIVSIQMRDGGGWVVEAERQMTLAEAVQFATVLTNMADRISTHHEDSGSL